MKKWYAIRTQNNKEKQVLARIINEVNTEGLSNLIGDSIVPTEKSGFLRGGKQVIRERIVYPGYVFLETSAVGEISNIIKRVNGCAGFLRGKDGIIPAMRESEVNKILNDQVVANTEGAKNIFSVGESITVTDGPFSTFKGSIIDVFGDKQRVKLQISIFGRTTDIELDYNQIEKN